MAAETEAVADLYDRHARSVFRFCLHQLRKPDEAEDAVQTTYLRALGALRRGVVPEAESAWLLTIARNVCLTRFDARRRRNEVELTSDPVVLEETAGGSELEVDRPRLEEALARLPQRQRRAIVMREWQGLSYGEIAAELGVTTSAVEALIFRARRSLAEELRRDEQPVERRALDGWSLLGGAKSLLGGGAAKIAAGAVAVASVGAAASLPLAVRSTPTHRAPAPAPPHVAAAPAPASPAPRARVMPARRPHAVAPVRRAQPAAPPRAVEAPAAADPAPVEASRPAAAAPPPPASTTTATAAVEPAAAPAAAPVDAPTPVTPPPAGQMPPVQTPPVQVPALPAAPAAETPQLPPVQVQTPTLPSLPQVPTTPTLPALP